MTGLLAVFEPDQQRREALIDEALAMAGGADEARSAGCTPRR